MSKPLKLDWKPPRIARPWTNKLETGTMLSFWHDIINRFNEVSKAMQKSDVLLSTVDVMLMTFRSGV